MRCAKSQKLYNMATIPLQICNDTDRCCKNFIVLSSLFCLLSLHFFFSLLSHSLVPSLFSPYRFPLSSTSPGCSPTATTAQLRRRQRAPPHSILATLDLADLTLFPLLSVRLSLCLALVVGFFFFFFFFFVVVAIQVDLMVVVGCGGDDRWWLSVLLMGCLGWGYGCLLWNLARFAWVCFELCFWLWWMWWLCGGG